VSVLAALGVLLILSTGLCLFDADGGQHASPAHDLCAGLVTLAVGPFFTLVLEALGPAYAVSRWSPSTATGAILDPPPRGILR
jgi:hypothetical protein